MAAGGEFVDGWLVAQLLGEGAYGEVRLLVHARSGACVALKVARGGAGGGVHGAAREAALQRALRHPHVVRCLGARSTASPPAHYTFLEYAAGGDLFARIEPDAGMPPPAARRYFRHLLAALHYLHARGVAHRDIKPENMLLDHRDRLKLSDFGLATLFRRGEGAEARERLLTRVCGTLPYAAPEVLTAAARPYRAPPADLWAAAVALVAMLAGELPWERAHEADARYAAWARSEAQGAGAGAGPWRKLRGAARALLRRALRPEPARRATLEQLMQHRWLESDESAAAELAEPPAARAWRSQPARPASPPSPAAELSAADMDELVSYSQPTRAADVLLASQLTQLTQAPAAAWARLTRVRVRGARDSALRRAASALRRAGLPARRDRARAELVVECGAEERMRAWVVPDAGSAGRSTLLEFRRARGCGLRFQRRFRDVRRALEPLAPAPTPTPTPTPAAEPMDVL